MKDELQGKLVEILTSIQNAAGKAGDFAMGQLPDIAQSYVAYGRAMSIFSLALGMVLLALAIWAFLGVRAHIRESGNDFLESNPAVVMPGGMFIFFTGLVGSIQLKAGMSDAALVWFAPKVWLLKEMAALLK